MKQIIHPLRLRWLCCLFCCLHASTLSAYTIITIDGGDRIVADGSSVTLTALLTDLPGLRQANDVLSVQWYRKNYDDADYPTTALLSTTIDPTTTSTDLTDTPQESSYYKAVLVDQMGASCDAEVLVVVADINIYQINFEGEQEEIRRDPTISNPFPSTYEPYWKNGESNPILYKSGDHLQLSLKVQFSGLGVDDFLSNQEIKLRVEILHSSENANEIVTFSDIPIINVANYSNGELQTEIASSPQAFPLGEVGYYNPMTFRWQISYNNGEENSWHDLEDTTNPIYVSANPINFDDLLPIYLFYSTVHLACEKAHGLSNNQQIVDAIYSQFMDRDVRKIGSTIPMQYWGNETIALTCNPVSDLLQKEDARCGQWASFFGNMLSVHGVSFDAPTENEITGYRRLRIQRTNNQSLNTQSQLLYSSATTNIADVVPDWNNFVEQVPLAYFFVHSWQFGNNDILEINDVETTYTQGENDVLFFDTVKELSADLIGIPAQGELLSPNPTSFFVDHVIIEYGGKFYDPSYGSPIYNSFQDWQDNSIKAFGSLFCINPSGETCNIYKNNRRFWIEKLKTISQNELITIKTNIL